MLLTNPFTFEQWSWIAGIFSAALPTIIWLTSLTRKLFQSDQQIMDQAFHGVRIGASAKTLQKLKLKQIDRSGSGAIKMIKWALLNGNELSVTYNSETDRIVYVEVDWCRKPSAFKTGLTKHKFGITTLNDIRKVYKSNGFTYTNRFMLKNLDELVTFNAFELKNKPTLIAVFITSISQEEQDGMLNPDSDDEIAARISDSFKLDAIALGDEAYLDEIWGPEKIYDPTSQPITL